jgi:hypothetical protein
MRERHDRAALERIKAAEAGPDKASADNRGSFPGGGPGLGVAGPRPSGA